MREGAQRQEQETNPAPFRGMARVARFCTAALLCGLTFGDCPSQADDFQHELTAARLLEASVWANQSKQSSGKRNEEDRANLKTLARVYQRLITRYPKNADAHAAYAEYLWEAGDFASAMAQWKSAESLDPRNPATASHLGGCYLGLGDAKKAIEYFARAASMDPDNPLYHFDLGNSTFVFRRLLTAAGGEGEQSILKNALAEFKKAAELDPFNADYARAYAETFYGLKQPDWREALKAWTHFLELKGPRDFCYANLARVNLKLGQKKEALEDLDQVTRPDFRPMKNHLLKEAGEKVE